MGEIKEYPSSLWWWVPVIALALIAVGAFGYTVYKYAMSLV